MLRFEEVGGGLLARVTRCWRLALRGQVVVSGCSCACASVTMRLGVHAQLFACCCSPALSSALFICSPLPSPFSATAARTCAPATTTGTPWARARADGGGPRTQASRRRTSAWTATPRWRRAGGGQEATPAAFDEGNRSRGGARPESDQVVGALRYADQQQAPKAAAAKAQEGKAAAANQGFDL